MENLFGDVQMVDYSPSLDRFTINSPYGTGEELKKVVEGVTWNRDIRAYITGTHSDQVRQLRNLGFAWTAEAMRAAALKIAEELELLELSRAASADLDLPGFGITPMPFQNAGILYASRRKGVIIGDEMGLGKTFQGLGTVYNTSAFPALVVTPASLKYNWAEGEIPRALPNHRVCLADKDTGDILLRMSDLVVTNYEQLVGIHSERNPLTGKLQRTSWKGADKKEVILSPLAEKLREIKFQSIICDEAHYLKNWDAARTQATFEVRRHIPRRILLTGTPMLNDPSEFATLLRFIDKLQDFGGWWHFMTVWCGMSQGDYGWETNKGHDLTGLNKKLREICYIRRLKADVMTELPPKTRATTLIDIDNRDEYEKAEKKLIDWVKDRVLQDKIFMDSIAHLPKMQQDFEIHLRQEDKAERAKKAEQMVKVQALKNVTARGKLKAVVKWVEDFLASGEKLVLFAVHKEMMDALVKKFPNAAKILASQDPRERKANQDRFQTDPECNLILLAQGTSATNSPGGVGWTLTASSNVAFFELGWNNALHDQCEDRCHRKGQEDNVTAHYLLGRKTIDIDIAEIIEDKRRIAKQVVDGDSSEVDNGILDAIIDRLAHKGD